MSKVQRIVRDDNVVLLYAPDNIREISLMKDGNIIGLFANRQVLAKESVLIGELFKYRRNVKGDYTDEEYKNLAENYRINIDDHFFRSVTVLRSISEEMSTDSIKDFYQGQQEEEDWYVVPVVKTNEFINDYMRLRYGQK